MLLVIYHRFEGYLEQQVHALLISALVSCAFACIMEVVNAGRVFDYQLIIFILQVLYDNRLVKFCRAYFCLLQGTWLIHGGFIMQVKKDNMSHFGRPV